MRAPLAWALGLFVSAVLCSASARAQDVREHPDGRVHDWLAWWPTCAQRAFVPETVGVSELLYPRPGLPAVARPGERLTTRVRLAAPLTPPPGVQQEKALRGWSASLEGRSTWRTEGAEHRYPLRVADVRPDTRGSSVFRASIDLPPWMAPGTYDLVIRAPGGATLSAIASVRVIVRDAPVLARLPEGVPWSELADVDVDVWVHEGDAPDSLKRPLRGQGLPWLAARAGAVLTLGPAGVVSQAGCDDPLAPRRAVLGPLTAHGATVIDGVEAVDGRVRVEGDSATIRGDAVLSYVVPEGWQVRLEGARPLGAWPATPVRAAGARPSVLVAFALGTTSNARPIAADAPRLEARLEAPSRVPSGRAVDVVAHADVGSFVALAWEEDGAAWGRVGEPTPITLRWMEPSELHGLVLAADGRSARVAATVVGTPRRPGGCAAGGDPTGNWWLAAWLCTIGAARYTSARSRPRRRSP